MDAFLVIGLFLMACLCAAGYIEHKYPESVRYPFPDHDAEPGDWRS